MTPKSVFDFTHFVTLYVNPPVGLITLLSRSEQIGVWFLAYIVILYWSMGVLFILLVSRKDNKAKT